MDYRQRIKESEAEIRRLTSRIDETVKFRDHSDYERTVWSNACSELHAKFHDLGWIDPKRCYIEAIRSGDFESIEYAITFVEMRPYFFRSGYMYKHLMRILKSAKMTDDQRTRYNAVRVRLEQFLGPKKPR